MGTLLNIVQFASRNLLPIKMDADAIHFDFQKVNQKLTFDQSILIGQWLLTFDQSILIGQWLLTFDQSILIGQRLLTFWKRLLNFG